jgi:hypothetical protein
MELAYNSRLSDEQIRDTNLVLAKAYELDQTRSLTTANLINGLVNTMKPQKVRDAVIVLYKCGFLYTPALLSELNDDSFFILRENKIEEAKKTYELFDVKMD